MTSCNSNTISYRRKHCRCICSSIIAIADAAISNNPPPSRSHYDCSLSVCLSVHLSLIRACNSIMERRISVQRPLVYQVNLGQPVLLCVLPPTIREQNVKDNLLRYFKRRIPFLYPIQQC